MAAVGQRRDQEHGDASHADGAALHRRVSPDKWCVTRGDLRFLRREIRRAIDSGRIQPTDRDPFDVLDNVCGPNVYTVCEQYIKPVTHSAGKMSWALMRHPEGLPCDLFVTHAWQEGTARFGQ